MCGFLKSNTIKPNKRYPKLFKIASTLPSTNAKAAVTPYMSFIFNGALYINK